MMNGTTPRGFLRPCVLLMVREAPVHGYELLERLGELGFDVSNPGSVYKLLRQLESEGVVTSHWENGDRNSHRRRSYELTAAGVAELKSQAHALVRWQRQIESFLGRYIEAERAASKRAVDGYVPKAPVRMQQVSGSLNGAAPPG